MIKLEIDNTLYQLPNNLKELNFKIGFEIEKYLENNDISTLESKKHILSMLLSCDYKIIDKIIDEHIISLIDNSIFFKNDHKIAFSPYLLIKNKLFKILDFEKMTVEKYSDIEYNLQDNNYIETVKNLIEEIPFKIKNIKYYFLIQNLKKINDVNYFLAKNIIDQYINYNIKILKYFDLINDENENTNENTKRGLETFGFYHLLMSVCDCNIITVDVWLTKNIHIFFKYLKYIQMKNIEIKLSEKY